MAQEVCVFFESTDGRYKHVIPVPKRYKFIATKYEPITGLEFHLFGFKREIRAKEIYYSTPTPDLNTMSKEHNRIRQETFKNLVDTLHGKAKEKFPQKDYVRVLVEITQDQNTGNYWALVANYQFMLRV